MADTSVNLNTSTWTEISTTDGANIALPNGGQRGGSQPDSMAFAVAANPAGAAAVSGPRRLTGVLSDPSAEWYAVGVSIPSGEGLYGLWLGPAPTTDRPAFVLVT